GILPHRVPVRREYLDSVDANLPVGLEIARADERLEGVAAEESPLPVSHTHIEYAGRELAHDQRAVLVQVVERRDRHPWLPVLIAPARRRGTPPRCAPRPGGSRSRVEGRGCTG